MNALPRAARRRQPPTRPTWPAWLLVGALLLAQALGWAHRLAHGAPAAAAQSAAWGPDHEAGGAACRLVDQLAHADALCAPGAAAAALAAWAPLPDCAAARAVFSRAPHRYDARAPPAGQTLTG